MNSSRRVAAAASCIVAALLSLPSVFCQEQSEGRKNYEKLEELFQKWNEGLFGSRKYHQGKLNNYLITLVGKEIETDYDFIVVTPELPTEGEVKCALQFGGWLTLHGSIDRKSLKEAMGTDKDLMKKWWRSGVLVAASGKVRKFGMDILHAQSGLDLYLYRIQLKRQEPKKTEKKN